MDVIALVYRWRNPYSLIKTRVTAVDVYNGTHGGGPTTKKNTGGGPTYKIKYVQGGNI